MFTSSIDSEQSNIRTDARVLSKVTHFALNGSQLEIEGYASIAELNSYEEDRIRKMLLLVLKVDVKKYREKYEFDEEVSLLTDDEIINLHLIHIPLENCILNDIVNEPIDGLESTSLSGYSGQIDLSTLIDKKPLESGSYEVYIQLEQ